MPFLHMEGLAKSFGDTQVLGDFSVQLGEGEVLALLGLSGSGKTTALRLLAGFEQPDEGTIMVDGVDVTPLAPAERGFGMVFQHYALFPHMTVAQNVAFGLESRGWSASRMTPRIEEMLALVNLSGFGDRRVSAISGGQQQRVALARALAPEPRLLLLDEPLSNLDPALREKTREELRSAVRQLGITTVLVTHEQEEAFHVGDRIAVLHQGRLQQVGSATELYRRPATPFVASFIGRSARFEGTVDSISHADTSRTVAQIRVGTDQIWSGEASPEQSLSPRQRVTAVVRPEALMLDSSGGLPGQVIEMRFTGALTYAVVVLDDQPEMPSVHVLIEQNDSRNVGERVHVARRPGGPEPALFAAGEDA